MKKNIHYFNPKKSLKATTKKDHSNGMTKITLLVRDFYHGLQQSHFMRKKYNFYIHVRSIKQKNKKICSATRRF